MASAGPSRVVRFARGAAVPAALLLLAFFAARAAPDAEYAFDDVAQVRDLAAPAGVGDWLASAAEPWWPREKMRRDWRPVARMALLAETVLLLKIHGGDSPAPASADAGGSSSASPSPAAPPGGAPLPPGGFLFFNQLWIGAAGVLIFALARAWGWRRSQAGLAAALAIVAPLRAELAFQIVGQAESLSALFMLAGLAWWTRTRAAAGSNPARETRGARGFATALRAAAPQAAVYALALGSKETALLYPLYLGLMELAAGAGCRLKKPTYVIFWAPQLAMSAVLAIYLLARARFTGGLIQPGVPPPEFENVFVAMSIAERLPAALGGLAFGLTRFFIPVGLAPDYSARSLPFDAGWAWPMSWFSLLILIALAVWAARNLRRGGRGWGLVAAGLAAWALTSNLFFTIGVSVASRIWAFPALAVAMAAGWALPEAAQRLAGTDVEKIAEAGAERGGGSRAARLLAVGVALWVVGLAGALRLERFNWRSNYDDAARTVEVFPESWRGHHNLARECYELRRFEEGRTHARAAVRLRPGEAPSWDVLGLNATFIPGAQDEAERAFRRALELDPTLELTRRHLARLADVRRGLETHR